MTDEREKNEGDAARYAVAAHVALTLIDAIIAVEGDDAKVLERIADVVKTTQAGAPRRRRRKDGEAERENKNEKGQLK